jgi:hypothetical protein
VGKEEIQKQNSTTCYDLSEEDFQKLADVLRVPEITPQARSQLYDAIRNYHANAALIPQIPREAEVKAALVLVRDRTKELIDCLENLDDKSQQFLSEAGYRVGGLWDKNKNVQALIEQITKEVLNKWGAKDKDENEDLFRKPDIYKLLSAAEKAVEMVKKDKGGRPKEKAALRQFIDDLIPIFEEITKRKATIYWDPSKSMHRSRFYDFTHKCLSIIHQKDLLSKGIWSDVALGQQIKKVLSSAKSISHF